jgi:ABC-type multidrug transport system fused ATPase/permease subunit
MSNIKNVLDGLHKNAKDSVISIINEYRKKLTKITGTATFLTSFMAFIGGNAFAAYRFIVRNDLKISEFSVMLSSIITFNARMLRLMGIISRARESSLYIQDIRDFLELKPDMKSGGVTPDSEYQSLEFRNVHLKLILRLYDPTQGEIRYNGRDIKEYDLPQYRSLMSVVFQDFHIFPLNLAENIVMNAVEDKDGEAVNSALEKSDLAGIANGWPNGIYTRIPAGRPAG